MNDQNPSSPDQETLVKNRKRSGVCEASRTGRRRFMNEAEYMNHNNDKNKGSSIVSTTLRLYEDPWKIKKTLTESDLGILSRLLLAAGLVKKQMLPVLGSDKARAAESEEGTPVRVWDMDTRSMHHLVLKRWSSSKSYVLIGKWNQDFVRRRQLQKGDEIGFYWDPYTSAFNFSLLKRAMPT